MLIRFLDIDTNAEVFSCGVAGVIAEPAVGDIMVDTDHKQYRVLQRAYIIHETQEPMEVVDLAAPKEVDVEIQCAVRAMSEVKPSAE